MKRQEVILAGLARRSTGAAPGAGDRVMARNREKHGATARQLHPEAASVSDASMTAQDTRR
jgi:hypothetical protein